MTFVVPQGGSSVCHIDLLPKKPSKGKAANWPMTDTSTEPATVIDSFEVDFSKASSPQQRQYERMIFVISISEKANTAKQSWRFIENGVQFCPGHADYLDDMSTSVSDDGQVLTCVIRSLTDTPEEVSFSFLAMRQDRKSGECAIYASADPGGRFTRR